MTQEPRVTLTLTMEADASEARRILDALIHRPEEPDGADGPILTWRAAAAVLGVSEDTVLRTRHRAGIVKERAHFANAAALTSWWHTLSTRPKSTTGPTLAETRRQRQSPKEVRHGR